MKKRIVQKVALVLCLSMFICYGTVYAAGAYSFTIRQYKYKLLGGNENLGYQSISCEKDKDGSASFSTTVDKKYSYEFWKSMDGGRIVGSGTLKY